jgi:hypothetical protein
VFDMSFVHEPSASYPVDVNLPADSPWHGR